MNAIKNITIGHTGYTMLANLVNIVPFCLSIEAIRIIFSAFDGSGQPLDTTRLWWIFGIMAVYMLVMALAERASYRANFRGAYEMSASGRLSLAEHLRKLSLGFLSKRDPGDLSSMLVTDFMMAAPTYGCHSHARTGFCFACMDRLEDGGQYVCRLAVCHACPVGKHKSTTKSKRQANSSENQCREPVGRILAGYSGNESVQSDRLRNFAVLASVRRPC